MRNLAPRLAHAAPEPMIAIMLCGVRICPAFMEWHGTSAASPLPGVSQRWDDALYSTSQTRQTSHHSGNAAGDDGVCSKPVEKLPQHCPRQRAVNCNACLAKWPKRLQESLMEVNLTPQCNADNCHSKISRCAASSLKCVSMPCEWWRRWHVATASVRVWQEGTQTWRTCRNPEKPSWRQGERPLGMVVTYGKILRPWSYGTPG
jgi:hypothetical protein